MNIWKYIPRSISVILLNQPIPENWKHGIERSLNLNEAEAINQKLGPIWKRNYSMIAALIVLIVSAFILFSILN